MTSPNDPFEPYFEPDSPEPPAHRYAPIEVQREEIPASFEQAANDLAQQTTAQQIAAAQQQAAAQQTAAAQLTVAKQQAAVLRPFDATATITAPTTAAVAPKPSFDDPVSVIEASEPQERASQPGSLIAREIIETFLLTLLIFWAVNTITGRFRIEGSSMMPTMQEGEYVLINKLAYYLEEPKRGDIIVLQYPRDPSRDFIKRVIGVPGDVVEVDDGEVSVNGQLISEPYINSAPSYNGSWTVPDDEFFVLGDNRNNSSDSHTWGFLPYDHIVGKGWVIYWPVDQMERIPHYSHTLGNVFDPPSTPLYALEEQ